MVKNNAEQVWLLYTTAWCCEIGSLRSLDARELHSYYDVKEPMSLHQAVHSLLYTSSPFWQNDLLTFSFMGGGGTGNMCNKEQRWSRFKYLHIFHPTFPGPHFPRFLLFPNYHISLFSVIRLSLKYSLYHNERAQYYSSSHLLTAYSTFLDFKHVPFLSFKLQTLLLKHSMHVSFLFPNLFSLNIACALAKESMPVRIPTQKLAPPNAELRRLSSKSVAWQLVVAIF